VIRADQGSECVSRDLDLWAYLRQAVLPSDPFERLDDICAFELERASTGPENPSSG
jgi:hypothetical protein